MSYLSRFFFLCAALLVFLSADSARAQNQIDFKLVSQPKDSSNNPLSAISRMEISSNGTMWLLCTDGLYGSTNRAITWQHVGKGPHGNFCFGADSTMYAASENGVFSSPNFGASWNSLNAELPNGPFYDIACITSGTLITGCPTGVFRSTDGGASWDHIARTEIAFPTEYFAVYGTPKGTVLMRNGYNAYFRSTDDGLNWTKTGALTPWIKALSPTNLLRQGVSSNNGLERSADDGLTWHIIPSFGKSLPYDIAMDPFGRLFSFVGWQLMISRDSGMTWSTYGTISGGGEQLLFTSDNTLYYSTNTNEIYRTLKPLAVQQIAQEEIELYPNPCNRMLNISLPTNSPSEIEIINVMGESVYSGRLIPSEHSIDCSHLPDGVYFVRISSGEHTIGRQIVVEH